MGAHVQTVRSLPGFGRFRTGISLQAPFKKPSELSMSGSSEDRSILFVSFPYFGRSIGEIILDRERETVRLLDFKRLGVDPVKMYDFLFCNRTVLYELVDSRSFLGVLLMFM